METKTQKLQKDIEELETLLKSATRKGVQDVLSIEVSKLRTKLSDVRANEEKTETKPNENKGQEKAASTFTVTLRNYSWDESDKFMKIYVTLKNVQSLNSENIITKFTESGFEMTVNGLDDKNHRLAINELAGSVNSESSYHKVKSDMVVIMIAKSKPGKWSAVTAAEQKSKNKKMSEDIAAPKKDEDPSASLMNIMKKMYDEGDDNMKRMLAKSWHESQQKQAAGDLGMGGMTPPGL